MTTGSNARTEALGTAVQRPWGRKPKGKGCCEGGMQEPRFPEASVPAPLHPAILMLKRVSLTHGMLLLLGSGALNPSAGPQVHSRTRLPSSFVFLWSWGMDGLAPGHPAPPAHCLPVWPEAAAAQAGWGPQGWQPGSCRSPHHGRSSWACAWLPPSGSPAVSPASPAASQPAPHLHHFPVAAIQDGSRVSLQSVF